MTDDPIIARTSHPRQDKILKRAERDAAGGCNPDVNLVRRIAEASRLLSAAESDADVLQVVERFASEIVGAQCAILDGSVTPYSGSTAVAILDSLGAHRATLMLSCQDLSPDLDDSIQILATQAGLALGCHALRESSFQNVTSRQVAEFKADRLQKLFDRRLEEALGERSIWAEVFKGSQYGVCIIAPNLRYLSFNPAFEDWFARHSGMIPFPGQSLKDALSTQPEVLREAEACWARALAGEDFIHNWQVSSRGREYHYETRYTPLLNEVGEAKAAVQFSLDVTERFAERHRLEVAEAAMRQSQKMEAVGKLTGGIAHDFNNILTGIVGAIDLIGRKIADGRLEAVPRYLDMAATSANRAASLTHRLLAFSRRQPVDPRLADVEALVLGMEEMISRAMGPDVAVETSTSGTSLRVLCDSSQLESALMNLIVNSREAMPTGGRLLIATGQVALDELPPGHDVDPGIFIKIAVSDNGCGMTPEVVSHAVEPFFTTKGIGNGTGLGLSMVYGFARQSGGFMDIHSAEAEGTTVSVYLPATAISPMIDETPVDSVRAIRGATVLLVEDEPAVRAIVVELLDEMGCHVIEAEDGGQGVAILSSGRAIDVLVTDIGLPVLNGRQVATVARSERPGIPILFMTGYSENATITEGFGGRTLLVTKPFRPAQISEALGRLIG
ncbi:response regulator [Sphingomonas sp. 3-13AW]|uniref:PAS domain-containing sensor histidine kinase n=1 Tax=Sphingomonas sp. 3-13AW TaxID=3050450 RepID=UPI003BB614DD